ncbi:MAG: branched-chain amino acid ABC transporter permease [Proteobacteria bacterium]|nr:branched-chain amino acid ABC transporter permease [Pseudomonadota bacterium]|tara:strand:- start:614 stop:1690 length:1077 start_codon:yes stop_codon:yes gene_type:complete
MFYREAGQFKKSYKEDQAILPILQDKIGVVVILLIAFVAIPILASDYWLTAILIPFLVFSLAALGLNLLTGYAGQLSLGTAAFMAVGAFAAYNFELRLPYMPALVSFVLAGLTTAIVGIAFGIPSLRIRGFYLAVATLAAQFFIPWLLVKVGWFTNYSSSGVITTQPIEILGFVFDSPAKRYFLVLSIVAFLALVAKNLVRSNLGRAWMAVRDMDVAAEVIGIKIMRTKLIAFGVSSFYCGVAGALYAYAYLGSVEPDGFNLDLSFRILFMIIIGGIGSIMGSFLGAAFITLLPIFLDIVINEGAEILNLKLAAGVTSIMQLLVFGGLIIFFLIVEPLGLARLWQIAKEKLRLWPFPH